MASAPMFLMKAENTVTAVTSRIICARGERTCGEAKRIATSTAPERAMAALTRRALATMMTMSSLKPLNASFGRHDAGNDRGNERQRRDEVVAQAPPDEEAHHGAENAEGEALLEGHDDRIGRRAKSNGPERLRFHADDDARHPRR